jgi:lysylphosphatidylglycerol synthetase-like protein (DUF2156 family)
MIIESITTQVLQVIFLALTPSERWTAARHPFNASSAAEGWLTVFAVVALITSVILVFWLIARHRRSEECLKRKIFELTSADEKLLANYRHSAERLKREIAGLKAANEKLRLQIAKLSQQTPAEASKEMQSEELEESEEPVAIQED